jgi:hypothetical protein
MTPDEIKAAITLIRRAPLQNMQEAEGAAHIIQKLTEMLPKPEPVPAKTRSRK